MGKFIVMDIVFQAGSLNYDQGTGNYQELKKITKWDGKQYTFVSRYALRYSLLETGKQLGLWNIADEKILTADSSKGDNESNSNNSETPEKIKKTKGVIQPKKETLFSGKILDYPEFDLFGYLVTSTTPQNFKVSPVKLGNAISMTPFNYDALFNANLGLANRLRKEFGEMSPNPFTTEEHITYYLYSVCVDVENIGKIEVYNADDKAKIEPDKSFDSEKIEGSNVNQAYIISLKDLKNARKERIEKLLKSILNLKRDIKGRTEYLNPKLLMLGLYENEPPKTFIDKIALVDEYNEEVLDIIEEKTTEKGKEIKILRKASKSSKPVFEVKGIQNSEEKDKKHIVSAIDEEQIVSAIMKFLESKNDKVGSSRLFADEDVIKVKTNSVSNQKQKEPA